MKTRSFAAFVVSSICLIASAAHGADRPSADELIRAVKDSEQWIHQVDSFYLRMEGGWSKTPEAIERQKAARHKEFPEDALDPKRWPELLPENPETLERAFDAKRFYKHGNQPASQDETALWDGERILTHVKYFSHDQEHYSIQRSPTRIGPYFLSDLGWLQAGDHSFWWDPHDPDRGYRFDREGAQKWAIVGREMYHSIDCWVLEREYGWIKWYIGVERPLLHGMIDYVSRDDSDASNTAVAVRVAEKFGGSGITTRKAFYAWKETLPKERAAEVQAAYVRGMLPDAYPLAEHTLLEYKEVKPGWWFPMLQSYDLYDADNGAPAIISGSRKLKAIEVKVNEPLADELFKMEMTEGVEVSDWSHEPPLHYKYKKKFTDDEWKTILDDANKNDQLSKKRKAAQEAVVGKPAPAFPAKSEWINSAEPLTLEKLRGKVVVVDFFADWCGPCRNDLPAMAQMFKDREKLPFMVMAIHPPGSERKSIDKVIKEFELGYPICIDVAAEGSWGQLFAAYKVDGIPHAVVIDKEGKVAGQGQLGEMVEKARELSR